MLNGLPYPNSRRIWFVPNMTIWGMPSLGEIRFLVVEKIDSTTSVLYGSGDIGPAQQEIAFADLVDHRGNNLPATLDSPKVIPRPRDQHAVFVVGQESDVKFKIARDPDTPTAVTTDLFIMEMGS